MALQFYLGRAGSGKSRALYERLIKQSIEEKNFSFMAVVPEQYSMETQKQIMELHPNHGSTNIEVTSFNRLAYAVFEEQGYSNYRVMDGLGQTLVIRKVLQKCKSDLSIYKEKTTMPGFAEKIKTVISELKQYDVSTDDIAGIKGDINERPELRHKLNDIEIIYNAFEQYIGENNITNEDVLDIFCQMISQSDLIKKTYFFFDGYTGFTPIQYRVLELLIMYSKGVYVALTLPENEVEFDEISDYELFSLSKETIYKLKELADKNGVEVCKSEIIAPGMPPARIQDNEQLCFVEEHIFRDSKKYKKDVSAVEVHYSSNPQQESVYAVRAISKLVREKGYRYNDIAIIAGDMEEYHRYLQEEFDRYDIPVFIDHKKDISDNPFIEGIKTAIEVVEKDFLYDSVFHLLRLGIIDLSLDDIDIFENYVVRSGRRGFKSYSLEWQKKYRDMEESDLETVNRTRKTLVEKIEPLRTALKTKNATIKDFTVAAYNFIRENNYASNITGYLKVLEERNETAKLNEYQQIYEAIIRIFDRLVELLGDECVSITEYKQLLQSGFENIKIGIIPPGIDTIMVGDIERTRLKDTKRIIFILGVNDGIIPSSAVSGGVITDIEREYLKSKNIVLAPTARENVFKQKMYLYSLLAKPTEKIILSYSKTGLDNRVRRKSYLITTIEQMMPNIKEVNDEKTSILYEDIITRNEGLRYISENIKEYCCGTRNEMLENLIKIMDKKGLDLILDGAFYKKRMPHIDAAIAKQLYGNRDNIGITRLERYASCAYSQFLKNGLKLNERKRFEIAAYDIGNLYHEAINRFFYNVQKEGLKWESLDKDRSDEIMNYCIEKVMDEYENDALDGSARNLFIKEQVRRTATKTTDVLINHINSGKFEPAEYELSVEHGRIDRVDVLEDGDNLYVKVIDYKSGNKTFSISDAFWGISMQLVVYLKDAIEYEKKNHPDKNVLPAGGLYFHVHDPFINKPSGDDVIKAYRNNNPDSDKTDEEILKQEIERMKLQKYCMSGLLNSKTEVLSKMDEKMFEEERNSDIIPVKMSKKGIKKTQSLIDEKLYEQFLDYMIDKTLNMKQEIYEGKASINPTKDACTYCPYGPVCGFDSKLGYSYRTVDNIKVDDLPGILNKKDDDAGENDEING